MPDTDTLIAAMEEKSGALRRLGHTIRIDLSDTGATILVDGLPGGAGIVEAAPETEAETILRLSSDDLAKLVAGKLSPMLAFATGRLKVEGSKGVAMKLASLLDEG